jgi:spore maturation protein CgeB
MKIVIFGLTMSSSWGNGHATLWRGLCRALSGLGHECVFFERDVPYYAGARDFESFPYVDLQMYAEWPEARSRIRHALHGADAAIVTSYCPDALAAAREVFDSNAAIAVFYDLDTPVTLSLLQAGRAVAYIDERGLRDYDLVLSYTGGQAIDKMRSLLGARCVTPLYGHVDPHTHHPTAPNARFKSALSYLGTYAGDRQSRLTDLFIAPARQRLQHRFMIAGAQYPRDFPWSSNIYFVHHLPPSEHAAFFCSSRLTLNVTRRAMVDLGWCPSGRLFEAAACGSAVLSDDWDGLAAFYAPGSEVLVARQSDDTLMALDLPDEDIRRLGEAARERTLDCHTSEHRARELIARLEDGR